jgi:hypothetical protein
MSETEQGSEGCSGAGHRRRVTNPWLKCWSQTCIGELSSFSGHDRRTLRHNPRAFHYSRALNQP